MLPPDRIAWLLDDLCVRHGFCLPPAARTALVASPPADSHAFAAAVFRAEGLDPAVDKRLYAQVHGLIQQRFAGSSPSDA